MEPALLSAAFLHQRDPQYPVPPQNPLARLKHGCCRSETPLRTVKYCRCKRTSAASEALRIHLAQGSPVRHNAVVGKGSKSLSTCSHLQATTSCGSAAISCAHDVSPLQRPLDSGWWVKQGAHRLAQGAKTAPSTCNLHDDAARVRIMHVVMICLRREEHHWVALMHRMQLTWRNSG